MGIKVSPWSDAHFRPGNTDELELLSGISVFPNPFTDYIQLNTKHLITKLTLRLYDPLGRLLLQCSGKPSDLNRQLQQRSNKLAVGNYLLYIKAAKEAPIVFKLSKTQ